MYAVGIVCGVTISTARKGMVVLSLAENQPEEDAKDVLRDISRVAGKLESMLKPRQVDLSI